MFVCNSCGYESAKWMGKCIECNTWNSFDEIASPKKNSRSVASTRNKTSNDANAVHEVYQLDKIPTDSNTRISTKSSELDRVLGGGMVLGSSILISGEPGIGKSTLMLQSAVSLSKNNRVLYICAEESPEQVAARAKRLNLLDDATSSNKTADTKIPSQLFLTSEYRIERIEKLIQKHKPVCVIIDSIQTIRSEDLGTLSGRLSHISACASLCCEWTLQYNTSVFIVAHVTKEGSIAGPKLIEHLVDTVLMFDSSQDNVRFLYSQKNRYGATDEVGVLHMGVHGLSDISDTGTFFLETREGVVPPGICVAATYEGTRPFLVEVQSLVVETQSQNRVFSDRIDARQIFRIAAVLERHLSLPLSRENMYINIAGGIRVQEPGFELALLLALYSAYTNISMGNKTCAIGEISLAGEIRAVENFVQRCKQAIEYGFSTVIVPYKNAKDAPKEIIDKIVPVKTVKEAVAVRENLN